jgi:hypothetical protein
MLIVKDTESGLELEFPSPPLPSVAIDDNMSMPDCAGVYFAYAFNDGRWDCVYVGESKRMRRRLAHRPELHGVKLGFLECDAAIRKRLESLYIAFLNPRMNAQSSGNQGHKSVDDDTCRLVLDATVANASTSKSGRAHYMTTAKMCHVRPKLVKSVWKSLVIAEKIDVVGDFAMVRRQEQGRFPSDEGFIVLTGIQGEPRGKSHRWLGKDTACRMWSTGGLPRYKNWDHRHEPPTEICNQCRPRRQQGAGHRGPA